MKNYVVKALRGFDDYEGAEIKPENPHIWRNKDDIFRCTKERCEFLRSKNAVLLVGIDKVIEPPKEEKVEEKETIVKKVVKKAKKK